MTAGLDWHALEGLSGDLTAEELTDLAAEGVDVSSSSSSSPPAVAPSSTSRVTVTLEGGEAWDLTLDARDRRAYALYADRYKLPAFTLTDEGVDVLRLELLTVFSAWHCARHRLKVTRLDWPGWNAAVLELVVHPDPPEVVAHPPERGAGS